MTELMEFLTDPWNLLWAVAVFGFAPGFVLRTIVKIYPPDDPRRHELVAQLYILGRTERLLFVAEQLETVLFEGVAQRLRERHAQRRSADSRRQRRPMNRVRVLQSLSVGAVASGLALAIFDGLQEVPPTEPLGIPSVLFQAAVITEGIFGIMVAHWARRRYARRSGSTRD